VKDEGRRRGHEKGKDGKKPKEAVTLSQQGGKKPVVTVHIVSHRVVNVREMPPPLMPSDVRLFQASSLPFFQKEKEALLNAQSPMKTKQQNESRSIMPSQAKPRIWQTSPAFYPRNAIKKQRTL